MGRPRKRSIIKCPGCGIEFEELDCEIKRGNGRIFCTHSCAMKTIRAKNKISIPKNVLEYLYLELKLSTYKIGKIFGCSQFPIINGLKENNIPIRTISERAIIALTGRKHTKSHNKAISLGQLNMSDESRRNQVNGALKSFHRTMGRRRDLGDKFFRSRWEANYARYLNWLITQKIVVSWEYEPDTFEFKNIKRGTRFYTPDFRITFADNSIEYHEVKGWDYPKGKTARKRFAKYYPKLKLILIDSDWFKAIKRQGIDKLIADWEYPNRKDGV